MKDQEYFRVSETETKKDDGNNFAEHMVNLIREAREKDENRQETLRGAQLWLIILGNALMTFATFLGQIELVVLTALLIIVFEFVLVILKTRESNVETLIRRINEHYKQTILLTIELREKIKREGKGIDELLEEIKREGKEQEQ